MRLLLLAAAFLLVGLSCPGCASFQSPPIEKFADRFIGEVVSPAVKEGLTQGVSQLTVQAGAQGINPTYVATFEGKWVVGIEGKITLGVQGVAGQIQVSSAGGDRTVTSPHAASQPSVAEPGLVGGHP